jgi:hypothetical protein
LGAAVAFTFVAVVPYGSGMFARCGLLLAGIGLRSLTGTVTAMIYAIAGRITQRIVGVFVTGVTSQRRASKGHGSAGSAG